MLCTNASVTDHFITINGLNMHYRDWGTSNFPPLVILHGTGNSHAHSWDHVAAALTDQYRVIVPIYAGMVKAAGHPYRNIHGSYFWKMYSV
jgi:pimeloyl-ACP methyl ester carboxylesterase